VPNLVFRGVSKSKSSGIFFKSIPIRKYIYTIGFEFQVGGEATNSTYEDGSAWDVDVVRSVFEGRVAEQVLQIPISRRVGEDFIS
jgi:hypothetical protein